MVQKSFLSFDCASSIDPPSSKVIIGKNVPIANQDYRVSSRATLAQVCFSVGIAAAPTGTIYGNHLQYQ